MLKLAVSDLIVGMYVVDTGVSWTDHPLLYSQEGAVRSQEHIDEILAQGFREVYVDPERGVSGENVKQGQGLEEFPETVSLSDLEFPKPTRSFYEELGEAGKLYSDSLIFARQLNEDVRLGRRIGYQQAGDMVDGLLESVLRNHSVLTSLAKLRQHDDYTYTHSVNVMVLALAFGNFLGHSRKNLRTLGLASLFHDLGKSLMPDVILNKPGRLTDDEFEVMKKHPVESYNILYEQRGVDTDVMIAAAHHHEKYNGSGYPHGLKAAAIHPLARIMTVADIYDALTSKRPYKRAIHPNKAMMIMNAQRGVEFFPGYMECFIACLGIFPLGSFVRLANGSYGVVVRHSPEYPTKPQVMILFDARRQPVDNIIIDLADLDSRSQAGNYDIKEQAAYESFGIDPLEYVL